MKKWCTIIKAIDPSSGELLTWSGPVIDAPSMELANEYCQLNGLGYCLVGDELIAEIPCDENYKPDFDKMIDYDITDQN